MSTRTRFEKETKGNSEMAYCSLGLEDSVCGLFGANSTILLLLKCEEDMTD